MAEQAVVKYSAPYVSENLESNFQRFKDSFRRVASAPKECVGAAIKGKETERKVEKGNAKNGR